MLRSARWLFLATVILEGTGIAVGQDYPVRPIRVVTLAPGANSDFVARLIAPELAERLGKQVVVDNRAGNGVIPAGIVASSPADGYTVLVISDPFWLLPFMQEVPYDPVRDFSPITLVSQTPLLVVVNPTLNAKSVQELVALTKAKPGGLNYASGISGSATHLAAELFKHMARVDIVRIGYKGGGPALAALLGGEVQIMFANSTGVAPHVHADKLRALAVTGANRSKLFPELPTVAESGLSGYEAVSTVAVFAPARTPAGVIDRLNREIAKTLEQQNLQERFAKAGSEVVGSSPKDLAATMQVAMDRMGKMIKAAGIRSQ